MNDETLILVVDDIQENIQMLAHILESEGYKVACSYSWAAASQFLKTVTPDLILLDVVMPEVSGIEACKAIKADEKTKDIPVIFLSALSDVSDRILGLQAGGVDYVTKQPFQKEELIERVKTHILLKKSLDTIKQNEIQLKKMNASKDRLFSIMSHDMKNPAAAIIGLSELLLMKCNKDSQKDIYEIAENINISILTLYNLMESLLEWSLIQSNEIKYRPKDIRISEIINDTIDVFKSNLMKKSIQLFTNIDEKIMVFCDPDMVKTTVRNLLSNAIKFTRPMGEIHISCYVEGSLAYIEVRDTGIGIEKNTLEKLFQIEEKFSTEGTMKEKGTGLGLILCKELVEKNHGEIFVTSQTGIGTSFRLSLPLSMI